MSESSTQSSTHHASFLDRLKRVFGGGASEFDQDEAHYRDRHAAAAAGAGGASAALSYERARPAYQVGHAAGLSPEYADRGFEDVEAELRRGYESHQGQRGAAWADVRDHARAAYTRGQELRIVLAEEQLRVGKREVQAGEVHLRTVVEAERVREVVPVAHDEVVIERHPLPPDAVDPDGITETEVRVPLMAEEVVVEKRVVPVEEVVVRTDTVVENRTVEDTVRRERLVTGGGVTEGGVADGPDAQRRTAS